LTARVGGGGGRSVEAGGGGIGGSLVERRSQRRRPLRVRKASEVAPLLGALGAHPLAATQETNNSERENKQRKGILKDVKMII
jgi:hypothetical protein